MVFHMLVFIRHTQLCGGSQPYCPSHMWKQSQTELLLFLSPPSLAQSSVIQANVHPLGTELKQHGSILNMFLVLAEANSNILNGGQRLTDEL